MWLSVFQQFSRLLQKSLIPRGYCSMCIPVCLLMCLRIFLGLSQKYSQCSHFKTLSRILFCPLSLRTLEFGFLNLFIFSGWDLFSSVKCNILFLANYLVSCLQLKVGTNLKKYFCLIKKCQWLRFIVVFVIHIRSDTQFTQLNTKF